MLGIQSTIVGVTESIFEVQFKILLTLSIFTLGGGGLAPKCKNVNFFALEDGYPKYGF